MTSIHKIKAERAETVTEMRAALNAGDQSKFDKLATAVEALDAKIAAEERMAAYETAKPVVKDSMEGQMGRYSIRSAIAAAAADKLQGLEAEVHRELENRSGKSARGVMIPTEAILGLERRDTNSTNAATTIPEKWSNSIAGPLRAVPRIVKLGASTVQAEGNGKWHLPVWEQDATPAWLGENASLTESSPTFSEKVGTYKQVGTTALLSRELIHTNGYNLDSQIGASLGTVLANELDRVAMAGTGGTQPLGVWNEIAATATTSTTISGIVNDLVSSLESVNNDPAAVLFTQKALAKARGVVDTNLHPISVGEQVFGMRYESSNQWPTLSRITVGTFSDLVLVYFGGIDVIVDAVSLQRTTGQIAITSWLSADVVTKFGAKSFAYSELPVAGS